ncbi:ASCH domain-containing protein [Paracidovorax wautersii]|uniref:ASCH domain-containing protein n=1 Tax=Paracidovorax wautersii TaxID=1177982 RepID=A0A1I2GC92_9BURK|nr:ASCH domain-containing protein [Paracidovorax wautersii]SFF15205.1 ASCH domain-containing protein [Paracidovorax wautersii]
MIPALSIRQPWAWLIVNDYKDIENRDWPTNFRGQLLVHAGVTMSRRYYDSTVGELDLSGLLPADMPAYEDLQRGGFVGWTRVVDCVTSHPSRWKIENPSGDPVYGFVLRESRPMPFVPWKGRLGFFNVPKEAIPS